MERSRLYLKGGGGIPLRFMTEDGVSCRNTMKNKKLIYLAAILLLALSCVGGTYAYFTYRRSVKNVMTVGYNTIEIDEDFEPPEEIKAGPPIEFLKTIRIKNTGNIPCYARLFCDFSDYDMKAFCEVLVDGTYVPASSLKDHLPEHWVYVEDTDDTLGGYYYYTEPIDPGKSSEPIFEKVKITVPEEKAEQIKDFDIIVYAESIQIKDWDGELYSGAEQYKEAWTEFLSVKD